MSLSSKIKTAIMAGALAITGAGMALAPVYADTNRDDTFINNTSSITNTVKNTANNAGVNTSVSVTGLTKRIINIILYVIGVLAVVMIIIGGIRYTTSAGDQAGVTKAKNTILYGIVGLVIALLAYAIINFVLSAVGIQF